jgi:hypothetical protein
MNRSTYTYGTFKTRYEAEDYLDTAIAYSELSMCEFADIVKRGNVWCLLLWAE